jgi:hypothetical protein
VKRKISYIKSCATVLLVSPLIVLAVMRSAYSQNAVASDARVEISTNKKIYSHGEPVKFRPALINNGKAIFHISKSLSYSSSDRNGANAHGFEIEIRVRQLSGMAKRLPG